MIITLGPEGTYAHQATQILFPEEPIVFADSIFRIFSNYEPDHTLVLPLENSSHGSIPEVWEEINGRDLFVSKTHVLKVEHAIGALFKNFNKVYGHHQALQQCRKYLQKKYPHVSLEVVASNALAVKLAAKDTNSAAIASDFTFRVYNLPILEENISDFENNETRFGVIADKDLYPNEKKTAIAIVITPKVDEPGLLLKILTPINDERVNMTRLESRPQGNGLGNYNFFIDLQTNPQSDAFKRIMETLRKKHDVKIIGAY
ncbi:hypothetical protein HZA43_04475 [Candidatus Peregrinibacteria bacterium]|nr:hypothetical protein [Candidatus Peregrinibacteria bacterium]